MSRQSYQARCETYQKIRIDQLAQDNAELTLQLHDANTEVVTLKLEISKLENGQIALTAKLKEEDNEIGRLTMVIDRQRKSVQNMVLPKKIY